MHLTVSHLKEIKAAGVIKPSEGIFALPEKVLQFGTGVLLRGLPDYFIDKANRNGLFNGRIVVVKSTGAGSVNEFDDQDNLYTLCIRGFENGERKEMNIICSAISRVLAAGSQWNEILQCSRDPEIKIVVSNTTEVGIQLVQESILQQPPKSFPAKLLALLYERWKAFDGQASAGMVIVATELISDNGKKLKAILLELTNFNQLEESFLNWLTEHNHFCNSLVDCIVPGKADAALQSQMETEYGYTDSLMTVSEIYRLWAIEGNEEIRSLLSFAAIDEGIVIAPSIEKFKELKLRLLNATHTMTCGLAYLSGIATVREAMENPFVSRFISDLMVKEIAPAIPYALEEGEALDFGLKVLDRFRNPVIQHQWLSISMQYSSKLAMRSIPLLIRYYSLFKKIPSNYALGFAAYLLFMKPVKKEGDLYFGELDGKPYQINDDNAAYYYELWQKNSMEAIVKTVLRNESLWGTDLSALKGFEACINEKMGEMIGSGVLQTIKNSQITDAS